MTPLVSILIPVYNRAAIVPQTIDSALSQSHAHIGVIVVDTGGTDGTRRSFGTTREGTAARLPGPATTPTLTGEKLVALRR